MVHFGVSVGRASSQAAKAGLVSSLAPPKRTTTRRSGSFRRIFLSQRSLKKMEPLLVGAGLLSSVLLSGGNPVVPQPPSDRTWTNQQTFTVQGVVRELKADGQTIVIRHEAVSNYMDAMTMPFKARNPAELKELRSGDEISFRLHVTETESWIDRISKLRTGRVSDNRRQFRGRDIRFWISSSPTNSGRR